MVGTSGLLVVRIVTPRLQVDFAVKRTTTGKQLFRQVVDILDLHEPWFFGLQFVDQSGKTVWLQPEERLTSRTAQKQSPLRFTFCARFWPQESAWTLGDVATELLFLQVRGAVLDGTLFCPLATAIELAAYALQARCGDFLDARLESGQLTRNRHLPLKLEGPLRGSGEWQERVAALHRRLHGLPRRDAQHEYLLRAQQLPGFGTTFYHIRCENPLGGQPAGRRVRWFWIGVTPFGINVYEDKLTPFLRISWDQIHSIRYECCKFTIKMRDREKFKFFTRSQNQSQELLLSIKGQRHAITMQRKGDGDDPCASPSEDVSLRGSAGDGDCLHLAMRSFSIEAEIERHDGGPPAWLESLEATGWLDMVQHWCHQSASMDNGSCSCSQLSRGQTASLPSFGAQSMDSGLASWSDTVPAPGAGPGDSDTSPGAVHPSTSSRDSMQFRLSITSDEVFA
ncbi:Radixin [Amphibalanus amphitrite]|uniref:Moesin/ezrin/radixin homolog 1 n=1 Tax=Amphibalanus amphitrite TaxID=1232801 RepID=A0A6A4VTY0_AMPAM|nr:Radixin [Amphibalanus amphitrite]